MKRWEIWCGNGHYWLELAGQRQEIAGLQRCVASFKATAAEAQLVRDLFR